MGNVVIMIVCLLQAILYATILVFCGFIPMMIAGFFDLLKYEWVDAFARFLGCIICLVIIMWYTNRDT